MQPRLLSKRDRRRGGGKMELKETSDPHNRPSSRSRSSIFFLEGSRFSTSLLVNASSFLSLFTRIWVKVSFLSEERRRGASWERRWDERFEFIRLERRKEGSGTRSALETQENPSLISLSLSLFHDPSLAGFLRPLFASSSLSATLPRATGKH